MIHPSPGPKGVHNAVSPGVSAESEHSRIQPPTSHTEFDRLARLTQKALGAPVAFLALVSEEGIVRAGAAGLGDSDHAAPLPTGLIQRIAAAPSPVTLADVRAEADEEEAKALDALGATALLGVPLPTTDGATDGAPAGALCALDRMAREWTTDDRESLSDLARAAANALTVEQMQRLAPPQSAATTAESSEYAAQLSGIVASAMDAIITVDEEQRLVGFNPAAEHMFGYAAAEILGQPLELLLPEPHRAAHADHVRAFALSGTTGRTMGALGVLTARRKGGEIFPIEASISQALVGGRKRFTAILRDVTARKRVEDALRESEERFRTMADAAPVMVWLAGPDALCYYFNRGWLEFTGRTLEQEQGQGWAEVVHPEDQDRCLETYLTAFAARQPFTMDYRLRRHDGEYRWLLDNGTPRFTPDGTFAGYIGSCVDITERKNMEEALRRSEDRLHVVMENLTEGLILSDQESNLTFWNRAALEMHGFASQEEGRRLLADFQHLFELSDLDGQPLPFAEWPLSRLLHEESLPPMVLKLRRRSGDWERIFRYGGATVRDAAGRPVLFLTVTDVTESIRAEQTLRENERRFRLLAEALPQFVWTCEPDGTCDYLSPRWIEYTGIPEAEQLATGPLLQIHPDDRWRLVEDWKAAADTGGILQTAIRIRRQDGVYRWFDTRSVAVRDNEGRVIKWLGSNTDIDNERRTLEALREQQERFTTLAATVPGVIYTVRHRPDGSSSYPYASPGITDIFGFTPEELAEDGLQVYRRIHPDDAERVRESMRESREQMTPWRAEFRVRHPERGLLWVDGRSRPVREADGGVLWHGILTDVTERKRAETDLLRVTQSARCLLFSAEVTRTGHGTGHGTGPSALHWNFLYYGGESAQRFLPLDVPAGKTYIEATYWSRHPEDRERVDRYGVEQILAGRSYSQEYRLQANTGRWHWVREDVHVEEVGTGRWRLVGVIVDITEQKAAEEAIQRQRAFLRSVIDTDPSLIFVKDADGVFTLGNRALAEAYGTTVEALEGSNDADYNNNAAIVAAYREADQRTLAEMSETLIYEEPVYFADGRVRWVETVKRPILSADGGEYQVLGISTDITERREAAERLRHVTQSARCLLWSAEVAESERSDGSLEWTYQYFDESAAQRLVPLRLPPGVPYHQAAWENRHPEDKARTATLAKRMIRAGESYSQEFRVRREDGEWRWLREDISVSTLGPGRWRLVGVGVDITENKRAEERLRQVTRSARCLLYSAEVTERPDGSGLDWRYLHFDEVAAQRFLPLDVPPGRSYTDINYARIHPEDRARIDAYAGQKIRAGEDYAHEYRVQAKDGQWRWIHTEVSVETLEPGRWRVVGVRTDITERQKAEEQLRESERRLSRAQSVAQLGYIDIDAQTQQIYWSDQTFRILGYEPGAFTPTKEHFYDRVYPEDVPVVVSQIDSLMANGRGSESEYRIVRPDGEVRWAFGQGEVIRDPAGEPLRYVGTILDITDRKRSEEELRFLHNLTRVVIEAETLETALGQVLERVCKVTGWKIGEAWMPDAEGTHLTLGYLFLNGVPGADAWREAVQRSFVPGKGLPGRAWQLRQPLWIPDVSREPSFQRAAAAAALGVKMGVAVPVLLGEQVVAVLSFFAFQESAEDARSLRLVTAAAAQLGTLIQRRRAEAEVRKLNTTLEERVEERTAQLEAANRELEAFSYSVSHDLRAPLRSISGFSQALLEDYEEVLDATGQDYLRRVCAAGSRMGQLIDDLLALSRVTRLDLELSDVDLSALARKISDGLAERDPDRAGRIEWAIAPGLHAVCDERLMQIALENLLGNAWKYTSRQEQARIEFGVREPDGAAGAGAAAVFFVRDNGAGFDMAYSDKLFGVFQRLHTEKEFEGNGVGLATVQRIVRRHQGRVWAEAAPGQGATFYFTLRAGSAEK